MLERKRIYLFLAHMSEAGLEQKYRGTFCLEADAQATCV